MAGYSLQIVYSQLKGKKWKLAFNDRMIWGKSFAREESRKKILSSEKSVMDIVRGQVIFTLLFLIALVASSWK